MTLIAEIDPKWDRSWLDCTGAVHHPTADEPSPYVINRVTLPKKKKMTDEYSLKARKVFEYSLNKSSLIHFLSSLTFLIKLEQVIVGHWKFNKTTEF